MNDFSKDDQWPEMDYIVFASVLDRKRCEAFITSMAEAIIRNGCYCVCHSLVSSRPSCVHCRPEFWLEKADPYCGMTAKGVGKLRSLLSNFSDKKLKQENNHE